MPRLHLDDILTSIFPKEAARREAGLCPFCIEPVSKDSEFRDELSRKEFAISGLCQNCQDGFFQT